MGRGVNPRGARSGKGQELLAVITRAGRPENEKKKGEKYSYTLR